MITRAMRNALAVQSEPDVWHPVYEGALREALGVWLNEGKTEHLRLRADGLLIPMDCETAFDSEPCRHGEREFLRVLVVGTRRGQRCQWWRMVDDLGRSMTGPASPVQVHVPQFHDM